MSALSIVSLRVIRPTVQIVQRVGLGGGAGGGAGGGGRGADSPLRGLVSGAAAFGEGGGAGELQWHTGPYAAAPAARAPREPADPRRHVVLLFPGQGAQFVGMGRRLQAEPAARDVYALAADVLGWDVARLCLEGPAARLAERCQPALLVTSLAALAAASERRPGALQRARAAAGFSLGELAALVAAGALTPEAALRVVAVREAAMAAAAAERPGGMATVWLAPAADARALAAAACDAAAGSEPEPLCEVANHLYPGCKVLAGSEAALRWLGGREARALGVRRAARLAVAGPWHSRAMAAAADAVRAALALVPVQAPRLCVVSGLDARAYTDAGSVRRKLARAVAAPVRWEQVLHSLYARPAGEGFPLTLALGPAQALLATLRQVNAKAWDHCEHVEV